MKQEQEGKLKWTNGKILVLGINEAGDSVAYIVKRGDKFLAGVLIDSDTEADFDSLEDAKSWCEDRV